MRDTKKHVDTRLAFPSRDARIARVLLVLCLPAPPCFNPWPNPTTLPPQHTLFPLPSFGIECRFVFSCFWGTMDGSHDLPEVPRSEPVFPPSTQEIPSSPPSIASDAGVRRKPKKPPPVTPRSFRRFFTPRSLLNGGNNVGTVRTNRQALKALSSPAVNRLGPAFTRTLKAVGTRPEPSDLMQTPSRKRKLSFSSIGSPLQSSPLRKVRVRTPNHDSDELDAPVRDIEVDNKIQSSPIKPLVLDRPSRPIAPVQRSRALQTSGGLFMRSVLGSRANRVTMRANAGAGWQDLTSSFYSRPSDSHTCSSSSGDRLALPFCTASCNSKCNEACQLARQVVR